MSELASGAVETPPAPSEPSLFSNEPKSSDPASQTSMLEKIRASARGVFERHNVLYKRTGGRPRKDGLPNKGDIPLSAPSTALPAGAAPGAALPAQDGLDPALVKRCCSAVIKGLTGFLDKLLFNRAKASGVSVQDAQSIVRDCTITQPEVDSFAELAEVCLRKYGVGTQYAPEIGLGCIVLSVGARYAVALKSFKPPPEDGKIVAMPEAKP